MNLNKACGNILVQLADLINQLSDQEFVAPLEVLGQSTLGQHVRHTLEFFKCLEHGFDRGTINYDKRAHNKLIENNKSIALDELEKTIEFISTHHTDKSLTLEIGYDLDREDFVSIQTNYLRELVYNIEHAVHHMAIIKIGVREAAPHVILPHEFGIAASTIRYQETISQHS